MLYLFVKFSLVPPVLVKEGLANPITALGRSWRLTKGNSVRLFVFYFLLFLAMMVVMMVISIVVSLIFALFGPQAALFGNALVAALVNAVWVSGFLAVLASVHEQLGGTSSVEISETFE
jgi:membrane-anchored glycerophosphoryl diester phosphodiesterase (GDPDase)